MFSSWTLWEQVNQCNTQVRFADAGNGYYYIIFRHSQKAVHIHGGGTANGTQISQWTPTDAPNLKWRFVYPRKNPLDFVNQPRTVMLESGHTGWFAHVEGGLTADGTNISVWSYINQTNLKWHIRKAEKDGYYHITSALEPNHTKAMHQHGGGTNNGDNITLIGLQASGNGGNTQIIFEDAGKDGAFWFFIYEHSKRCVHLHGGVGSDGANVTQWEKCDYKNVYWRFHEVRDT